MKQQEIWQVQVQGQIYESDFNQLTEWINEGRITKDDLVKRGNLRWLTAGKVPSLMGFFNSTNSRLHSPVVTTTDAQFENSFDHESGEYIQNVRNLHQNTFNNKTQNSINNDINTSYQNDGNFGADQFKPSTTLLYCNFHRERFPEYICETCTNLFCRECPQFGENGKIVCEVCESTCKPFEAREEDLPKFQTPTQHHYEPVQKYISDDVLSGANWFFWIAALTFVNSLILLSGVDWAFFLGLAITQIFDVGANVVAQAEGSEGFSFVHLIVFAIDLSAISFFCVLGYFARKGAGWAFILGMVLYGIDALICLLLLSFVGIAIHAFALYCIYRGYSET